MSDTAIEWTDKTWNPIVGCSIVSPGCTNCYAMTMARRIGRMRTATLGHPGHYFGMTKVVNGKPVWTGQVAFAPEHILTAPLRWKKPRRIFVNSMGDLFHESVPDAWIDRVFAVMALASQHTFQVLTKRSKRMREYMTALSRNADRDRQNDLPARWQLRLTDANPPATLPITFNDVERWLGVANKFDYDPPTPSWPLPNVHLGVSAEDQTRADERIPDLLATPAAVRFVSAEPLLGPINFRSMSYASGEMLPESMNVNGERCSINALEGRSIWPSSHYVSPMIKRRSRIDGGELYQSDGENVRLDWIIVGGESGKGARPMAADWARSIRDQCRDAGVAYFHKQNGEFLPATNPYDGLPRDKSTGYPMVRVGKKQAGRLLDGVEHNEMPR